MKKNLMGEGGPLINGPVYNDPGPLPAQHTDASHHLSDVAGPPATARPAYGVPLAKPTTQSGPDQPAQPVGRRPIVRRPTLNGGPDQPAQRVP